MIYFLRNNIITISLLGRTALVCGSSKGIGKASAFELAKLDANIILLARSESELKSLVKELPGQGKHSFLAIDISEREKLKISVQQLLSTYNKIHILVNNTGGPKGGLITEATEDEFLQTFQNHVLVSSLLANLLLSGMKEDNYGRIINIISTSVKIPLANLGVSNTIRGAMASWAKTLSNEVARFGITVNNILPGYTDTERLDVLMSNAAQKQNKTKEQIRAEWEKSVPIGRFARPEEIASAVAFLASPSASYINGINLPVDGGRTGSL